MIDALIKRVSVTYKCYEMYEIGEKRCNCSCFEIDQEMDAILLIIGIIYIYIYMYIWKLNQTVLELDLWANTFLFFPWQDLNSYHWCTAAPIA